MLLEIKYDQKQQIAVVLPFEVIDAVLSFGIVTNYDSKAIKCPFQYLLIIQ